MKLVHHSLKNMCLKGIDDFIPEIGHIATLDNLDTVVLPPVDERNMIRVELWFENQVFSVSFLLWIP